MLQARTGIEHELDLPSQQIVQRRRGALVRNVGCVDPGRALEHLRRDVRRAAAARRSVGEFSGVGARVGDELVEVFGGHRWMNH